MGKKRILVVDDEQDLCDILLYNLNVENYQEEAVNSAEEALEAIHGGENYDLILLDVMMSGMSGFELARRLKDDGASAHIPIIFLTAKNAEEDTLQGFDLGADDYITKPFSVREVMARVNVVLKRNVSPKRFFRYETLEVDTAAKTVTIDSQGVALTLTEYRLLTLLLSHQGQVFTRQQLLESAWPDDVVVTTRTVDVNITRLRKKIGPYAPCIVTRQGFGYCFEPEERL